MISFSISDLISLIGVVLSCAAIMIFAMVIYSQRRQSKYDQERHRVELEMMRRSIETQMHRLNEKLLATEGRWRDVNHLLIASQNRQSDVITPLKSKLPFEFLRSAGVPTNELSIKRDLVFVLTPFHPIYREQFEVIASVCRELGLQAMRGDESFITGDVFPHILRMIAEASVVVANIDGRNPNVFYELGIAHAMEKPTILIAPTPEDVPFDIRTKRIVLFQSSKELRMKLKDELARIAVSNNSNFRE